MPVSNPLDLIIIGGGIGCVIGLYYAKKAGLKVLLLEKQSVAGGLWSQLPAWQDIQINPLDWTLGDIPITRAHQAGIAKNIQAWVDRFDLAPWMLLDTPVRLARETESGWMLGVSIEQMNRDVNLDLRGRYEKFGLLEILPPGQFDFSRDQLVPGRRTMIENFSKIERRQCEIARIFDNTVQLSGGEQTQVDLILWGTGYGLDLGYFDSSRLAAISRVDELASRCACLFKSLDARNLFFLAVGLEATGSAPWSYAHACRSIVSHIRGKALLDDVPVARKVNHFDLVKFLAERDPENYPLDSWFSVYRDMALNHPDGVPMPIP